MATNEPMTDERLAGIRARIKNTWKIQAVGPANMGDLEQWQLQSIAVAYVDDVADLLAEVDRLRAREQALAAENESLADRLELLRSALSQEEAENAAMRPIVEAVAAPLETVREHVCMCDVPYDGPHESQCMVAMARAFVAAHPATDTAGETESEEE